ncbi:MAG TPA: hypothetical protein VMZ51_04460 [Acidimicrobiales bacterium]|nr:hypothetical protein [Acidimicrobiales bacterium]
MRTHVGTASRLLVPGGVEALRRRVLAALTEADWEAAASGFGDPDLADE